MNNIQFSDYFVISSNGQSQFSQYLNIDLSKGYTHAVITSACIPKTYYVLPEAATLIIMENGTTSHITFPAGNYNINSFQTFFNSFWPTPNPNPQTLYNYSVSFPNSSTGVQTSLFTFNVTGNSGHQPTFTTQDLYLASIMGFVENTTYQFNNNSLTSVNVINFQSYDEILIKSNMVANNANLLQEIYSSSTQYNSSIIWQNANLELNAKRLNPTSTNVYSFALFDEDNNPINLNGSEWSFILMLFKPSTFEDVVKKFIEVVMLENENKKLI